MNSQHSNGEPLSVRVAREIADHEGVDPTELSPPLYHSLDPTALNSLFEPTASGGPRAGRVTFTYDRKRIAVDSDGDVTVEPKRRP